MKLISLYIENFGGLSQYALEFREGVTVIQGPNGFGKTTLAEFIRAMFYGFPRKSKTLDKSKRQKYTPWNGGKCGGNLVFEYEGQRFRLERTFGATPKSDTFKLIDLATGQKSDRFSEEIGLELFQLDGDSFERSTYLPQLHEGGSLTTTSIQAKLGDLVEDAGDVGNFDTAIKSLKAKRITYQLYKGEGGTVAEAKDRISRLQRELDQAEGRKAELEQNRSRIEELEQELAAQEAAVSAVRAEITGTSEMLAVAAVQKQYGDLTSRRRQAEEERTRLEEKYPNGLPELPEIDEAQKIADRAAVLAAQELTTQADLDAQRYLEENRGRFAEHIPDQEELDRRRKQCDDYLALTAEAQGIGLTGEERGRYKRLRERFAAGVPGEETLNQLADRSRELQKLRHTQETLKLPPEEAEQLTRLEGYFAAGVPGEAEIRARRQDLLQCQKLRQTAVRPAPVRKKASPVPMVLALLLGVVGIGAGVVLLMQRIAVLGGIALGTGILALIGAVFLGLRLMVSRELAGSAEYQAQLEADRNQSDALEQRVRSFTEKYTAERDLSDALYEIEKKREDYLTLTRRRAGMEEKCRAVAAETAGLEETLCKSLGDCEDYDRAVLDLRLARSQLLDLQAKVRQAEARAEQLHSQAEQICGELNGFFAPYYEEVNPAQFTPLLAALQRDRDAYLRAQERTQQWQERKARHESQTRACGEVLTAFFGRFGIVPAEAPHAQLRQLRQDAAALEQITGQTRKLAQDCAAFEAAHQRELAVTLPEQTRDLEELKLREQQLNQQVSTLTRQLLADRQKGRELRAQVDRIPQLRDELDRWQDQKNADQKKAGILDDTMEFLQKARDSLNSSYLGPIRESFEGYMDRLNGGKSEQFLISPDLEVQLERQGQARELGYFSAGQTDLVMLCMRLALVDALFTETKPFVILDDPFVNLDDTHTAEALDLLRRLGQERQILYLTCNSSRKL